jgi:TDG/mug DNA glycosylase family protein
MEYQHVTHESLPAFYDEDSKILILGSLPSVATRKAGFYYAHPQNRFFKVLSSLFQEEEPKSIEERKSFLKRHHIALFDVIYECDIKGSSDSSIKNVVVNDFDKIKRGSKIKKIFTTGKTAYNLYCKYVSDDVIYLPSSSPANAAMSLEKLIKAYQVILPYFIENK